MEEAERHTTTSSPTFEYEYLQNHDWEATCTIYSDLSTQLEVTKSGNGVITTIRRTLDIPLTIVKRITFCRPVTKDFEVYRVWALPEEHVPVLRVELVYDYKHHQDEQDEESHQDAYPTRVGISLRELTSTKTTKSIPKYPHSWPDKELQWLDWLRSNANTQLQQEQLSYAVCNWLEHHAMDYFGEIAFERDGYFLLIFRDQGPTYYNCVTYVVSSRNLDSIVEHAPDGGNTESKPAYLCLPRPSEMTEGAVHPFVLEKDAWLPVTCQICFDSFLVEDMATITCGHKFCRDCLEMYLSVKVDDIRQHRDNPFRCPDTKCRVGLPIIGCVKQYLSNDKMDIVRLWYKDLKQPRCHSLPNCLSSHCGGKDTMRKTSVDSSIVTCDRCNRRWCEWCLKKVISKHETTDCEASICIQFCQRYLAANDEARAKCEERWPWIKHYARARIDNDSAETWLNQQGGQVCPVCRMGIQRSEGCFHIHCTCGTHFCYECGEELFYPFYGTHHCWERNNGTATRTMR